jgi:hypothetical protein
VTGGQLDDDKTSITIDGVNVKARSKTDYGVNTRFVVSYPSGKTGKYSGESTYGLCDKIKVSYSGTIAISSSIEYGMVILPYTTDIFLTTPTREISTVDQMNEWLQNNNVQLVYKLATPVTYPQQPTAVKSIGGDNNIWANTGEITKAKYVRDLNITINELIERV